MRALTRRELLGAGLGGAALSGCSRAPRSFPVSNVSIFKAASYGPEVYDILERMLAEHKLDVRGKRVVLKPNLVEFDEHTCINTHPVVVHAAYEAFRKAGRARVRIAEGPGHRRGTLDLADAAGYFSTLPRFEDLFTDLNTDAVAKREIRQPESKLTSLYLPHTVLDCDLLVSVAKMKTHHWAGATLAMKNLFGLVPGGVYGWPKNVLHWAGIPEAIVDLHHLFPRQFAIVRRNRRHGGQWPHPGDSEGRRRACGGARCGGRGCDLLPHHGHRSAQDRVSEDCARRTKSERSRRFTRSAKRFIRFRAISN